MKSIERLAEGLWAISFPHSMSGVQFGTRTTIVSTSEGLLLISPGPIDQSLAQEIEKLGKVAAIIAPNLMHHLYVAQAQKLFPQAQTWLAPGLEQKRKDLRYDHILENQAPSLWSEELAQIQVNGMPRLNETVFFHRNSQTLILTDLAFNFHRCEHWPTRLVLKFNRAWQRFGPSRLLRHFFLQNQAQFIPCFQDILQWPFERVIVAHGDILESGGREALQKGYSWLEIDF